MRKKLILIGAILAVLIASLWIMLGWYHGMQLGKTLEEAQTAYETGYENRMIDLLEEADEMDPDNLKVLQTQARLLDAIHNEACLTAYRRLAELQPQDIEALKAWLGAMIRYEKSDEALAAYDKIASQGSPLTRTAAFSQLGAQLALTGGDLATQLSYLREAYTRDPQDGQLAFELCWAELGSLPYELSSPEFRTIPQDKIQPVMTRLNGLLDDPEVQVQAGGLLLAIQSKLGDDAALTATAERLWSLSRDNIQGRLLALEVYHRLDRTLFEKKLRELTTENQREVPALTAIFDWLLTHGENALIIELAMAENAPENLNRPPVANRVAEAMIQTDQLKALRAYDAKVDWTSAEGFASLLPPLTRTLDRAEARKAPNPAFTRWLASASLPQLIEVLPAARRLNFEEEEAAILQEIIRDDPYNRDAYSQLYALREANRDSLGMLKLLQEQRTNFPHDRATMDEYAWVAMVLNVDRTKAGQLALNNFSHDPNDPQYRVTWALVQCFQGEPDKALETLAPLEELSTRGLLVKALAYRLLDQQAEAKAVIDSLDLAALLPEERRMVLESRPLPKPE